MLWGGDMPASACIIALAHEAESDDGRLVVRSPESRHAT